MRVNVIGNSNGVGLSRDLSLLASALQACGCDVTVTALDQRATQRRRSRLAQWLGLCRFWWRRWFARNHQREFDVNIMMEHIWPEELARASVSLAVPNPEWFDRHDQRFLGYVGQVWAKTVNTQAIFTRLGKPSAGVGFDSEDRLDGSVTRVREFFHLAGRSSMKGTERLLKIWRRHPEWPRLVITQHGSVLATSAPPANNIEFMSDYLNDNELRVLQNRFQFHLCTSETEGWGHYLVEAMSVGAIAITLDAPPMNELVTADRGLLIAAQAFRVQKLAQCFEFDEASCVAIIERAMAMEDQEIARLSTAAREWFLNNKAGFHQRVKNAMAALPSQN